MRLDLDERWLERIWRYSVLPYLEEQFFDEPDRIADFALEALRRDRSPTIGTAMTGEVIAADDDSETAGPASGMGPAEA